MTISFSGMSSGIDTQSIITALVSVERNHQTLLKTQQADFKSTASAFSALATKLSAVKTAADSLADTSTWAGTAATSSSTAVTATATGTATSSITFNVTALAKAHAQLSTGSVSAKTDIVASSGTVTLTDAKGTATAIDVGGGSLSEVIDAINASSTGVTASAMQTSSGVYRLKLQANSTGADSQFTSAGIDGMTSMSTLTSGQDAKVWVGDPVTGFEASSATNTFSTLASGLSFTVSKLEDGVTVSSALDSTDVATKVQALVTAANAALSYIDTQTKWDATLKTGGPLMGEGAVRSMQNSILNLAGAAGVSGVGVTADGQLSFDKTKFDTGYKADPAGVAKKLGGSMTSTVNASANDTKLSLAGFTSATRAGTYALTVTQAATREQWTAATLGVSAGKTFAITQGTTSVSYTAGGAETLADTVTALNDQFKAQSQTVAAELSGDGLSIVFKAAGYGSADAFSVTLNGATQTQNTDGLDVAGTIDGLAATGTGQILSLKTGQSDAVGLSVQIVTTSADVAATSGAVGSVGFSAGLGRLMSELVQDATDSSSGGLSTGQSAATNMVDEFQKQIDNWDTRLSTYQAQLLRQFTAMESMINTLKTQSSALTNILTASSTTSSSTTGTLSTSA